MIAGLRQKKGLVLLALALLLALVVLLTQSPPQEWETAQRYGAALQTASIPYLLLFAMVGVLATAVGLPRQLFAFICGFAFGVLPGVAFSLAMAICGCAIAFSVSRKYFREWLRRRYEPLVTSLDALTQNDAFWKVVILRFQPLGTNLMTNLAAGISPMPAALFLSASIVGYIPQMVVFSLIGSGVRVGSTWQLVLSLVLLTVSFFLGLWLLSKSAARKAKAVDSLD